MLVTRIMRALLAAALAVLPATANAVTSNGSYSTMYVFGDSLVDAGNIAILTGGAVPDSSVGYYQGRFTNGYDYTDILSQHIFGAPTVAALAGGNNFAFGGARIVTNASDAIPDIAGQFGLYQSLHPGAADSNALYVLNFGGNDIFALGSGDLLPYPDAASYIAAAASQYANAVQYLNNIGARNILITGIPNATDPLAYVVDAQLQAALDGLTLAGDTTLFRFSYLDFFNTLQTNPAAFGLPPLDTSTSCIAAGAQASGCAGIFSFDGTHPTAAVQDAIAREIARQFGVASVPEPDTWALLIVGFGVVGLAARRRRTMLAA
jgi:phospholipase/lecithinase/hemolysin